MHPPRCPARQTSPARGATAASLSDFQAEHLASYAAADAHELVLRADGTCSARTYFGTSKQGQPVDPGMPCQWSVIRLPGVPLVDIEVVAGAAAVDQQYFIGADGESLVLYSYLTDPDAQRYPELSRTRAVKPRRRTTGCS